MKADFSHANETFKRLNPHLFAVGSVSPAEPQPVPRRPQGDAGGQAAGQSGLGRRGRVILIRCARRALDDDNLAAAFKFLRDAIATSLAPGLPPGRADAHFTWEYGQHITGGEQGTIVRIEI